MNHSLRYEFGRVVLSPLTLDNLEALRILRNREKRWFIHSNCITSDQQQEWFAGYLKKNGDYMFEVLARKPGAPFIGSVALYNHDVEKGTLEFGRLLVDSVTAGERGLGLDVTLCACMIAFRLLHAERTDLEVFRDNERAIRTYRKAGFSEQNSSDTLIRMQLKRDDFIRKYGNGDDRV